MKKKEKFAQQRINLSEKTLCSIELKPSIATSVQEKIVESVYLKGANLGSSLFQKRYRCRLSYFSGSMYRGLASERLVVAMAKSGFLSFFGSAGFSSEELELHIKSIQSQIESDSPYGMCLIANINHPEEEFKHVELFIKYKIPVIEAAAFSAPTVSLVYCRSKGLTKTAQSQIKSPRRIIAKCSRVEVAGMFLTPAPMEIIEKLLSSKMITEEEAKLSQLIPLVDDLAIEADSGGHTDQGVAFALVPSMLALKDLMMKEHQYHEEILVGCGGGIGTPKAVAAAFALGVDFIFTGSINQCTVESGAHDVVKEWLAKLSIHDTVVAPAGDMFEINAKTQVVKKNTEFPKRANKLYQIFQQYNSIDDIPLKIRQDIEKNYFKKTFTEVWDLVCAYKIKRSSKQLKEAQNNPRIKMKLIFQWYFSHTNKVAFNGDISESDNFQIHCGPAMGAFNQWVKGTKYQDWKYRHVNEIAELLMDSAYEYMQNKNLFSSLISSSSVNPLTSSKPKIIPNNSVALSNSNSSKRNEIAIIGVSGQFPKAENLDLFWENIAAGKDCISEVPPSRWSIDKYFDQNKDSSGKSYCKWMGVLENADQFDPLFFHISPADAQSMDPQQRLFLENAWHCIEDAGINPYSLSGMACGVFVGCSDSGYGRLSGKDKMDAQHLMGSSSSILSARIAYLLNLKGPCLAIDTACSSSLVAIAQACDSLLLKTSDLALAGGVSILCGPELYIMTSKAGMLSENGRCFTFDQNANGFVPGEGVGVILLKRLSDAIRDSDNIYGVIKGWGINQDGKTNGITAPSVNSQTALEKMVYNNFDINPETVSLIEAHGTGTILGDPIEVEALTKAFQSYTQKEKYCALGSIKSNIGHLLSAAGVSGVIKVLLALKHQKLPPTINYRKLNQHISLQNTPFYINTELKPWQVADGMARCAAVSSFGFSGTNAHIVIEEFIPRKSQVSSNLSLAKSSGSYIILLSAQNKKQLVSYAKKLINFIQNKENSIELIDLAYTLQVGRHAMEERFGLIVSSMKELREKLKCFIDGQANIEHVYQGQVKQNKETLAAFEADQDLQKAVESWCHKKKFDKLLDFWVKGLYFDWEKLYLDDKPKRISAPGYPFIRDHYWINSSGSEIALDDQSEILHPLLHKNTSHFQQQCFSTIFNGTEYFLRERRLQGQKELPAVACLEMIREAYYQASGALPLVTLLKFKNVIWISPITVTTAPVKIKVLLFAEKNDEVFFEIYSENSSDDASGDSMLHCQGRVAPLLKSLKANVTPSELKADFSEAAIDGKMCYDAFRRLNVDYGSCYQVIKNIYVAAEQIIAQLVLPSSLVETTDSLKLHPSLLEGALQIAALGWQLQTLGSLHHPLRLWLPFALDELDILANCSESMWVRLRQCETDRLSDNIKKFDIDLYDDNGALCASMKGLSLENRTNDLGYVLRETGKQWLSLVEAWQPVPLPVDTVEWHKRLRIYKEHNILMLSDNAAHYAHLQEVCSRLNHLAGDEVMDWKIKYLPIHDNKPKILDLEKALEIYLTNSTSAQIIFLMLSNTLNGHEGSDELALIFRVLQLLERAASGRGLQLYCCYPEDSTTRSLYREGLAGLFKSVMLEGANHRYRTIAYDTFYTGEKLMLRLVQEWLCDDSMRMSVSNVSMVCYKNEERFELQVNENSRHEALDNCVSFRERGCYLMVGALGGVGELICQELGRQYHAELIIFSRRERSLVEDSITRIEASGATVRYYSVDILDRAVLEATMKLLQESGIELDGVIHMARQMTEGAFRDKTFESFIENISAKVMGSLNIDAVTAKKSLDFFLICNSMAAFGNRGLSDYSYAGAFQSAMIRHRNRKVAEGERSGRSLSICWGPLEQNINQQKQYEILEKHWKPLALQEKKTMTFSGTLLILVNEDSHLLVNDLLQDIGIKDESVIVLKTSAENSQQSEGIINFQNESSIHDAINDLQVKVKNVTCLLDLTDLYYLPNESDHEPFGKINFYQRIIASYSILEIIYITKGLQFFRAKEMSLAGSQFAGLIKMLSVEDKQLRSIAVDIDEHYYSGKQLAKIVRDEFQSTHKETEVCYRESGRFVPHVHSTEIISHEETPRRKQSFHMDRNGVYVISGGTGGIGLKIADYLVKSGARHLVLIAKTPLPTREHWSNIEKDPRYSITEKNKVRAVIRLEEMGCLVDICLINLQDYQSLSAYFDNIRQSVGEIKGVIHSAVSFSEETYEPAFINKSLDEFRSIYKTKVYGMNNLQKVFNDCPLDFFISFSSTAGQIPYFMKGLSAYGMANSYLDYFTNYQVFKGNPHFRSLAWVGWIDVGMHQYNQNLTANQKYAGKMGLLFNDSKEGINLFEYAINVNCENHNLLPCLLNKGTFNENKEYFYRAVDGKDLISNTHIAEKISSKNALELINYSLQSSLEVPCFIADNNNEKRREILGVNAATKEVNDKDVNNNVRDKIKSFETGRLSKPEFLQFLKTVSVNDCDIVIQKSLIHAIKQSERKQRGRSSSFSTLDLGNLNGKADVLLNGNVSSIKIQNELKPMEFMKDSVSKKILAALEKIFKINKDDFDWERSFQDYGLDSINAMQLTTLLEKQFHFSIRPDWFLTHSTISSLVDKFTMQVDEEKVLQ